jgi:hypothetical protein
MSVTADIPGIAQEIRNRVLVTLDVLAGKAVGPGEDKPGKLAGYQLDGLIVGRSWQ